MSLEPRAGISVAQPQETLEGASSAVTPTRHFCSQLCRLQSTRGAQLRALSRDPARTRWHRALPTRIPPAQCPETVVSTPPCPSRVSLCTIA